MTQLQHYFYLFSGEFASRELGQKYFLPYWEPEPDFAASDEEYEIWEDRNPTWPFCKQLNHRLDQDFVELNYELENVISQIKVQYSRATIAALVPINHNCFFMIQDNAFSGQAKPNFEPSPLEKGVIFIGKYAF